MNNAILLLIVGFSYIVIFGGISLFRREGLSLQFAGEAVTLSLLAAGADWIFHISISPPLFLLLLYILTMRGRLLVELATFFARRDNPRKAQKLFALALRLFPDASSKLIIEINQAVFLIKQNSVIDAITLLKNVLAVNRRPYLGAKYEAATHYNLGIAFLKLEQDAQAVTELNQAIEVMPASEYAHYAATILEKRRHTN